MGLPFWDPTVPCLSPGSEELQKGRETALLGNVEGCGSGRVIGKEGRNKITFDAALFRNALLYQSESSSRRSILLRAHLKQL